MHDKTDSRSDYKKPKGEGLTLRNCKSSHCEWHTTAVRGDKGRKNSKHQHHELPGVTGCNLEPIWKGVTWGGGNLEE